jgi:hypothetical protein
MAFPGPDSILVSEHGQVQQGKVRRPCHNGEAAVGLVAELNRIAGVQSLELRQL